jgi:apolipoprotein N-acyltransferase
MSEPRQQSPKSATDSAGARPAGLHRVALPLIGAILLLPFANGAHSIWAAAFLAPIFLLRLARITPPRYGLLVVYALQTIAFAVQFRGMVPVPGLLLFFITLIYGAASTAPYVADRRIAPRLPGWASTLVFPCAWAATEYVVSFSPYGSWGSAAYSLYGCLPLLQLLSVTGLWGLTFLIGWVAAAGNRIWELATHPAAALRTAAVTAGVVAAVALTGGIRLALFPPGAPTVRIASLSKSDLKIHSDPEVLGRFMAHRPLTDAEVALIRQHAAAIDDDLLERADREARAGARIVFWGEANAPVLIQDQTELIRRGGELAKRSGIYLGMALAGWHLESVPPLENKLVLIGPDGNVAWESFKAHPVPGGESAMSVAGDGKLRVLETPYGRLSSVICFDADFPRLLAQAGHLEADIVLDPSNDWQAIDPWHTQMASFRAIEQGFSLVRQTSLGLSAAFDYQGHRLSSMDHYVAAERVLVSQVPTRGVRTLYSRLGDWFAYASLVGLALTVAFARRSVAAG